MPSGLWYESKGSPARGITGADHKFVESARALFSDRCDGITFRCRRPFYPAEPCGGNPARDELTGKDARWILIHFAGDAQGFHWLVMI